MKQWHKIPTGEVYAGQTVAGLINPTSLPSWMVDNDWRMAELPDVTEGFTRVITGAAQHPDIADECLVAYMDYSAEQVAAQAYQAKLATITPQLAGQAFILRAILRRHFGEGAETNTDVTVSSATNYFATKSPFTAEDARDVMLLKELFEAVIAWTGDNTIWTFAWGVLPDA